MENYNRDKNIKIETYISNPINAFLLTKRLTYDWDKLEQIIATDLGNGIFLISKLYAKFKNNLIKYLEILENVTRYKNEFNFPTEEDFRGATIGLQRLQQTYKIAASSMADGELNGIKYRYNVYEISLSNLCKNVMSSKII